MISIAVCDDNELAAQEISEKVKLCCPPDTEVTTFYHTEDILFSIKKRQHSYDIVLMDIEFSASSGIEAAKQINAWLPECQIIYITNYINYFSSVYETAHIYCILKKEIDTYLDTALKKAMQQLQKISELYLIIQCKQEHIRISQSKILYLERIMRTTNIYTKDTIYQTSEKINSLQERLCPWFAWSHRSYMINCRHITNMNRHCATLSNGVFVPVSRSCYENLQKTFARCIWSDGLCQVLPGGKDNEHLT